MFCNNCGAPLQENQKFCPNCGSKAESKEDIFAENEIPAMPAPDMSPYFGDTDKDESEDAAFRSGSAEPQYSSSVIDPAPAYLNGQDKVTMAVICFFLGGLGIHNFMMGENKKGIFRIVTTFCCGIGAIFALIDFIKILCDSYVVNPDALV